MRTRTRRLVVGTAAGLTLALASPLVPAANAHGTQHGGPEKGRHGWHSTTNPAEWQARKALRAAIWQARGTLRVAVVAARTAFFTNPDVVAARAERKAIVDTATDPALILAANDAYLLDTAAAGTLRDDAIATAVANYETSIEAAYVAYDTATTSADEAVARAAFRAAVRTAVVNYRAGVKSAHTAFRTATAPAKATMRASVNAARAVYDASPKAEGDATTFAAAVAAAKAAYLADPVVVQARTDKRTSLVATRTAYKTAMTSAKNAFFTATGHKPIRIRVAIPHL